MLVQCDIEMLVLSDMRLEIPISSGVHITIKTLVELRTKLLFQLVVVASIEAIVGVLKDKEDLFVATEEP